MIRSAVLLAIVVTLMASARSFQPPTDVGSSGVALGFGFLLLAALLAGSMFNDARLPRLTGYLVLGVACGPELSGLLTPAMLEQLGTINGVAVGLIALSAGSELNIKQLRPRLRAIAYVGLVSVPLAMLVTGSATFALARFLPFLADMTLAQRLAAATIMGVVFATLSPSVTLGILAETRSAGPLSETVLGVVVLADIVIVVLFALASAVAAPLFGVAHAGMNPFAGVSLEVFGSMGAGVVVALALAVYIKKVGSHIPLFVIAICYGCAQIGSRFHLDVLIICLTAGIVLENVLGVHSELLTRQLGPAVVPVFAVFFAVAGARMQVRELRVLWPLALLLMAVRAAALSTGARLGTSLARAEPQVARFLPIALLPEVGMSVGLVVLVERQFPSWGPGARSLVLSVIAANELLAPVLLRLALVRAGEAGRRGALAPAH